MLYDERMLSLDDASRTLPGCPSKVTLWRWCVRGVNGVRLEHRRLGRKMWTSAEALDRFSRCLAEHHHDTPHESNPAPEAPAPLLEVPRSLPTRRADSIRRAQAVLERAGI